MGSLTILYLTDNSLDPILANLCRGVISEASVGIPIVSVSQKPIDFGENICVGDIGRSGLSIDVQMIAGLEKVETQYVAIAEHDCLYSSEHFNWVPKDDDFFWYNDNCWLVQYKNQKFPEYNGMYSHISKRRVQSQLICSASLLMEATKMKLEILSDPNWLSKYPSGRIGEPGAADLENTLRLANPESVNHLRSKLKDYIVGFNAKDFETEIPNLDIRHESNFTGQRRGKKRCFEIPYWGRFENVIGNVNRDAKNAA